MNNPAKARILILDDEQPVLNFIRTVIEDAGYEVFSYHNPLEALKGLEVSKPDLILLDIRMPEMDGYEFCLHLQKKEAFAYIPVVFLTALTSDQDRAKAFAVGGVDFLTKPILKGPLVAAIEKNLKIKSQWNKLKESPLKSLANPSGLFGEFQIFLSEKLALTGDKKERLMKGKSKDLFSLCPVLGISSSELAQYFAHFTGWTYCPYISPESLQLGKLPAPFCRKNLMVTLKDGSGREAFAVANPFDGELFDLLRNRFEEKNLNILIVDFKAIEFLLSGHDEEKNTALLETPGLSAIEIADNVLFSAVSQRTSDIHIEPKEAHHVVRFRVDGDMKEVYALKKETGIQVISRFKVLAGMDIAERRKPQDGALEMMIQSVTYKLRLATTSTPHGESMIIRLLDPNIKPKALGELGMTEDQVKTLTEFANRDRGFVLVVGPTGSGKTTTIYSLLAQVDCKTRSLCTVEDPVEYRIPFANQQQVNEKAGITFESVLKSTMRQDPDVLFLGEVRDPFSAKASLDFASTGHLTITTLHTSNATTAIFRLERLGATRSVMADTLLGVVAQRLLKKLCDPCKKVAPPTPEEIEMLSSFMDKAPEKVANPVGCVKCNHTGYYGREGIYEIIRFDAEISKMIRTNKPIAEIRDHIRRRGDYLISHHAVDKVKQLKVSPKDAYEKVLIEEAKPESLPQEPQPRPMSGGAPRQDSPKSFGEKINILVAEDSKDNRVLISLFLRNAGYVVTEAEDGIEALLYLGQGRFDLIISDIDMPNLDGFKLLEMVNQKALTTPVLFVTARTEDADEARGFELGAVDYIKKPIKKEILLARVKKTLRGAADALPLKEK